jgi:hypothetical protein
MLEELGVSEERRLKCNAHILLAIDNALNKTFSAVEMNIGIEKLISTDAAHVFSSSKDSIWILGLIALAKLLSPSHESISLYTQYQGWLKSLLVEVMQKLKKQSVFYRRDSNGFRQTGLGDVVLSQIRLCCTNLFCMSFLMSALMSMPISCIWHALHT